MDDVNEMAAKVAPPTKTTERKGNKTKKQLLLAMVSKPNGVKLSTLCNKLKWQPHSVRGALSELKKAGVDVERRASSKGSEAVYIARTATATVTTAADQ